MNRRTLARDAAMSLWLSYRHLSFGDNLCAVNPAAAECVAGSRQTGFEDFQYVKLGGPINF